MSFIYKLALANLWLLSDLVSSFLAKDARMNPLQRSTTTIDWVVVDRDGARARVRHRVHPLDTSTSLLEHNTKVVDDDR